MTGSERRISDRKLFKVPLQFEILESNRPAPRVLAETENISPTGIFMISPQRLPVGSMLQLTLQVPIEISGSMFTRLQCRGRVVHEQMLPNNILGYGIEIEKMGRSLRHLEFVGTGKPAASVVHGSQELPFRQFGSDLVV